MNPAASSSRPRVLLGVSGSIASYKAVEVARLLVKAGAEVDVVMTKAATRFVGEATFAGITGRPVHTQMFAPGVAGERHVQLGAAADLMLLVPATAELLGALAMGRADDLLRATALCTTAPIVAAPAMHPRMWHHPATARHVATLAADGRVDLVGPVEGEVASGDVGFGRMAEPDVIVAAALARLSGDLDGRHILVSAGPTVEDLDPARYLSNRSSGKMGFAIAGRAAARGARVTLVAGPVSRPTPGGVSRVDVRSAREMQRALDEALEPGDVDALVMTAAVADYRPAEVSAAKLKRGAGGRTIELVPNPDLLATIGARRAGPRPILVGFALETVEGDALIDAARGKLARKKVDVVVANRASDAFDRDDNVVTIVTADDAEPLPRASKPALADRLLDRLRDMLKAGDA